MLKRAAFSTLAAALVHVCAVAADPKGPDYSGQNLTGRNFTAQRLEYANFEDAILKQATFMNAILTGANFKTADLTNTGFVAADLTKADLRGANLNSPLFSTTIFNEANLEGTDFSRAGLYRCQLRGANLRDLKAISTVQGCDFYGADVRGANLAKMSLSGEESSFRKVKYNSRTLWPTAFDPAQAGAVLVDDEAPAATPGKP
jgi:uncharacterized protein YjbI with pentapeptide repeats